MMGKKDRTGDHLSYLFPAGEKEFIRVNSVGDGATDERKPVENHQRFIGVFEQELAQNVDQDGEDDESGPSNAQQYPDGLS